MAGFGDIAGMLEKGTILRFKGEHPWGARPSSVEAWKAFQVQPENSEEARAFSATTGVPLNRVLEALSGFSLSEDLLVVTQVSPTAWTQGSELWKKSAEIQDQGFYASSKDSKNRTLNFDISRINEVGKALVTVLQDDGDLAFEALTYNEALKALLDYNTAPKSDAYVKAAKADIAAKRVGEYRMARFMKEYFRAYFRSGHMFAFKWDTAALVTDTLAALPEGWEKVLNKDKAQASLTKLMESRLCTNSGKEGCIMGKPLGKTAFISRSGSSYQFQGWTVTQGSSMTMDHPKTLDTAPHLVRVFMEALFDSASPRVPAVATATACVANIYAPGICMEEKKTTLTPEHLTVLKEAVAAVDDKAAKADAMAGAVTGHVIRGLGWAALNNEATAASLENLGGVFGRKVGERVTWQATLDQLCRPKKSAVTLTSTP